MTEIKSNIVDDQSEPDFVKYKVVILGDGAVGKTSLALRFIEDQFGKQYKQTIGVDFFSKRIGGLPGNVDVCLQVWDIGGQSIGAKMISNYIYGSDALIFVYDVTNYQSFQNLDDWIELAKNLPPDDTPGGSPYREPIKILMANKVDLEHLRTVKKDRHDVLVELMSSSSSCKPSDVNNSHALGGAPQNGAPAHGNPASTTSTTTGSSTVNHSQHMPPFTPSSTVGISPLGNPVSFFVSAKTGAQVQTAFRAIAAELAGVCLSAADIEAAAETPMSAHIMDYLPRNDPAFKEVSMDDLRGGAKTCVVQ